jgi:ferredoxin
MLFIDPDSCIDCQACTAECPTGAIFFEEDVPEQESGFIELNAEMAAKCPVIVA